MGKEVLLEIKNLRKYFPMKNFFGQLKGEVKAVDDVSFEIYKGETFGLVGRVIFKKFNYSKICFI